MTDWTALRLERARAEAAARDDADSWRFLRDLAAACGREDEARAAAAHLDTAPAASAPSRRRRKASRAPVAVPRSAPESVPAPASAPAPGSADVPASPLRCLLLIRSATPKARRAWLLQLLGRHGASVIESDVDSVRADLPPALLAELESHAELDVRRIGESA